MQDTTSRTKLTDRQMRFVQEPRVAVLATVGPDGAAHTAPVWYRFEDGMFVVLTDRGSQKHRNIERDPRVELCIDDKQPPYHTVIVRGRATVEPSPGEAWREELAIHYLGEDAGKRYVRENPNENGIAVRITPARIIGW